LNALNQIEKETDRLVALFLSNDPLTDEERDAILLWLDGPLGRRLWEESLNRHYASRPLPGRHDTRERDSQIKAKGWREIAARLGLDYDAPKTIVVRRPLWRRAAMRVAAVVVPALLIAGGYVGYRQSTAADDRMAHGSAPAVPYHKTVDPHADSVRTIVLSDGTEVTLNRNSTFSYNDNREGELRGEAWFKVAEDPAHPFVIRSEHMTVTVFGTEFTLHTHTADSSSKLALYDGAVVLDHAAGTHRLETAGKQFTLDHATKTHGICDFDHSRKPEWAVAPREGFDVMAFAANLDRIETLYGVEIAGRESVDLNRLLNFVPDRRIPIDDVMSMLEFSHGGFGYTIDGNHITLRRCE
jgi:ferric-dicitrate binding protein FerR (iron transport regulator)